MLWSFFQLHHTVRYVLCWPIYYLPLLTSFSALPKGTEILNCVLLCCFICQVMFNFITTRLNGHPVKPYPNLFHTTPFRSIQSYHILACHIASCLISILPIVSYPTYPVPSYILSFLTPSHQVFFVVPHNHPFHPIPALSYTSPSSFYSPSIHYYFPLLFLLNFLFLFLFTFFYSSPAVLFTALCPWSPSHPACPILPSFKSRKKKHGSFSSFIFQVTIGTLDSPMAVLYNY